MLQTPAGRREKVALDVHITPYAREHYFFLARLLVAPDKKRLVPIPGNLLEAEVGTSGEALIGAGGLGEPILSGIQLRQGSLILQGAVPAALLALLVQRAFDLVDRVAIPRGLRLPPSPR